MAVKGKSLTHNKADDSWSVTQNGETRKLIRFKGDGTIEAFLQDGQLLTVTPDAKGYMQVRDATLPDTYFAFQ